MSSNHSACVYTQCFFLVERVKRMKETKGKKKSRRTIKDDQEVTATVEGEGNE